MMNDFTKEELEVIFHELRESREWSENLVNPWPLLDKIQSMIDNYCEHEQSGEVRDIDFIKVCTKCKEVTEWI